ncbi:unnamed protein product [Moneuplotes crassus]|uniref:Uncharacterized protein n=1 Tax=Euplotes crassus TaxID=5936 RepID=A0AAD1XZZ0_EUPCR|nr:unnamed protein product [Moneuplotes crassus]
MEKSRKSSHHQLKRKHSNNIFKVNRYAICPFLVRVFCYPEDSEGVDLEELHKLGQEEEHKQTALTYLVPEHLSKSSEQQDVVKSLELHCWEDTSFEELKDSICADLFSLNGESPKLLKLNHLYKGSERIKKIDYLEPGSKRNLKDAKFLPGDIFIVKYAK